MTEALFISDLHLAPEEPAVVALFEHFCRERARNADALFILGDLFEAWVGDDARDEAAGRAGAALAELSAHGVTVRLMHGNRDFLLGEQFAAACGAELLPDPVRIEHGGRVIVLSHGDGLCTADADYMALRPTLRSRAFAADLLARPLSEREHMARGARAASRERNANAPEAIMDVAPAAVEALLEKMDAELLIHGHTHRPQVHRWSIGSPPRTRTRVVLGDWQTTAHYAVARGADIALLSWPPRHTARCGSETPGPVA